MCSVFQGPEPPDPRISILLCEYENLLVRDRNLTSFYHRFATIGATIIGAVFYYATAYNNALYHAVPFLVASLVLFLEYWRMDTVKTNSNMRYLSRKINSIVGAPVLIANQIEVDVFVYVSHKKSGQRVINPMFILICLLALILLAIIILSYIRAMRFFQVNDCWKGWPIIYTILSWGLLGYMASVVARLEAGQIYSFWHAVSKAEYCEEESEEA